MLDERLSGHRAVIGLLQMGFNPLLVEMVGPSGYDFLILDGEHGVFSDVDFSQTLQALSETSVLVMVRLARHDAIAARQFADLGADVIVVPRVDTADHARALTFPAGVEKAVPVIVIIESEQGVLNAAEILSVDGVVGAIVGANDLTADLGCPGDYEHPAYLQALSQIERAAGTARKILGTFPHGRNSLEVLSARGYRLFVLGTDAMLMQDAMSVQVASAQSCFAATGVSDAAASA